MLVPQRQPLAVAKTRRKAPAATAGHSSPPAARCCSQRRSQPPASAWRQSALFSASRRCADRRNWPRGAAAAAPELTLSLLFRSRFARHAGDGHGGSRSGAKTRVAPFDGPRARVFVGPAHSARRAWRSFRQCDTRAVALTARDPRVRWWLAGWKPGAWSLLS